MQVSKKFARDTLYDALVDSYNETQADVTRETLRKVTGLKQVTVDEHLRQLIDVDQKVQRGKRGNYRPAHAFPESRAVSGSWRLLHGIDARRSTQACPDAGGRLRCAGSVHFQNEQG